MNMANIAPDYEEKPKSLAEYLDIVRRRKKNMQIAAAITFAIAVLAALFWPPTYRATATILIEAQEIPQDLVRSTITGFANQEIQVISQRVLTLNTIMDIVQKYGLWSEDELRRMPRSEIVKKFQDRMNLDVVSAEVMDPRLGRAVQAAIAFTLSFDHKNPAVAQKVTNELVNLYMNENLKSRTEKSTTTSQFLKNEAEELNKHILEIQEKVSAFKQANEGSLPELYQYNLSVIERTEIDIKDTDYKLAELQKRKLELQGSMATLSPYGATDMPTGERVLSDPDRLKALRAEYRNKSALYSADHPDVVRLKREIDHLEQTLGSGDSAKNFAEQLKLEQDKLAQLKQSLTADHPEVIKQQRVVDGLLAQPAPRSTTQVQADNPAYLMLDTQLKSTESDIRALSSRSAEMREKIAKFEKAISAGPEVEKKYTELMRDLDTNTRKFQEIRAKQMEAELGQNLETERKGERYSLIQPPILPDDPVKPNRIIILLIGIILSGLAAAATAGVAEMLDDSIRGQLNLTELLGAAPLGCIPYLLIAEEQKAVNKTRRKVIAGIVAALVVALLIIHFAYKPLDVLWFVALRKLGLGY